MFSLVIGCKEAKHRAVDAMALKRGIGERRHGWWW